MKLAVAVDVDDGGDPEAVLAVAVDWCIRLGATLDVLYVQGPQYAIDWISDPAVRALMAQESRARHDRTAGRLADLVAGLPAAHRGVARILSGSAASALAEAGHGYDGLMLATHGRTGIRHFWLGSVTEAVVRTAPCAVLVLRLPA